MGRIDYPFWSSRIVARINQFGLPSSKPEEPPLFAAYTFYSVSAIEASSEPLLICRARFGMF